MAKKLDRIIVVDVESTCWLDTPPNGQESEIIEIGICEIEVASLKRLDKESILVKPEKSTVSNFCTQLTTLTQEQVDEGIPFTSACSILRKRYLSQDRVWASYGDYDRRQFERQCQSYNIGYPFGLRHINVKTFFALAYNLPRELNMAQALEVLNIPLEGVHHRGADDAWNIANILSQLLSSIRNTYTL